MPELPDVPNDDTDGEADEESVTGTSGTERDEHVGRVAGADVGYEDEQGGERRKKWDEEHGTSD